MNYTTKTIVVRYVETDQMKFVHHSNYLKYFEMARLEWLASLGVSSLNVPFSFCDHKQRSCMGK